MCEGPTAHSTMSGSGCRKGPPGFEREGSLGGRTGLEEMAGGMEKQNCDGNEALVGDPIVCGGRASVYGKAFMLDDLGGGGTVD